MLQLKIYYKKKRIKKKNPPCLPVEVQGDLIYCVETLVLTSVSALFHPLAFVGVVPLSNYWQASDSSLHIVLLSHQFELNKQKTPLALLT